MSKFTPIYINNNVHITLEKLEKIEFMQYNRMLKLNLKRLHKLNLKIVEVVQHNYLFKFYEHTPIIKKRNKKIICIN